MTSCVSVERFIVNWPKKSKGRNLVILSTGDRMLQMLKTFR
jgi:hypothetical protein